MNSLRLILALALPTVLGYLGLALVVRGEHALSRWERLFLAYGIGLGLQSMMMFIVGYSGISFSYSLFMAWLLVCVSALSAVIWRSNDRRTLFIVSWKSYAWRDVNTLTILLVVCAFSWIGLKAGLVIVEAALRPLYAWDTWFNWSAGAKFFYYRHGLALDSQDPNFFGTGYRAFLGHPLLTPMLQVWCALAVGEFHEALVKIYAAFYYMALIGLLWSAVRRETSVVTATVATFFLATSPLLTIHGTEGYADLPLGYYSFAAFICFWRYLKTADTKLLAISGALSGMAIFSKNEGIFIALAILTMLVLRLALHRKDVAASLRLFVLPCIAFIAPWIVLKMQYRLSYDHELPIGFIGWDSVATAIQYFITVLLCEPNFNLAALFLIIVSILSGREMFEDDRPYVMGVILLLILQYFSVYVMIGQEYSESLYGRGAVNRNMLAYITHIYFLASIGAYRLLKQNSQ